ncbi:hypothetical protein ACFB49_38200 [Sphingomonas sp. DBB INV C78]
MPLTPAEAFVYLSPRWMIVLTVIVLSLLAFVGGRMLARLHNSADKEAGARGIGQFGIAPSLALFSLLVSFTLSMAVDRFDRRRSLLVDESTAITRTYVAGQFLPAARRHALRHVLIAYADARLGAKRVAESVSGVDEGLLANATARRRIQDQLWKLALLPMPGHERQSSALLDAANQLDDVSSHRIAVRLAHVPLQVHGVLLAVLMIAAALMGFACTRPRDRTVAFMLLLAANLALILTWDIDRPVRSAIEESQAPLESVRLYLLADPLGHSLQPIGR